MTQSRSNNKWEKEKQEENLEVVKWLKMRNKRKNNQNLITWLD